MERVQHQDVSLPHTALKLLGTPHWENKPKTNYLSRIDKYTHLKRTVMLYLHLSALNVIVSQTNSILIMFTCNNNLEK